MIVSRTDYDCKPQHLGITKIISVSTGETVLNPRFYGLQERLRTIRQRAASRKVKGSKNRRKAYRYLASLENKVACQREDFQWKLAKSLNQDTKTLIVFEDLNVFAMMRRCKPKKDELTGKYLENGQSAKTGLNRAIWDAAWGSLKQKVKVVAVKSGNLVYDVNPRHSSQECSKCGYISPTNRDGEKFICESCGHHSDADVDAAIVIRQRGLNQLGISIPLPGDTRKVTPKKSIKVSPGREHQQQYVESGNLLEKPIQLSLLDFPGWMGLSSPESPGF
ncbi:MAG: hypothetical protein NVSMB70_20640 [Chamaesiphon sp.]